MSAHSESIEDLRTDAIPEPPRHQQKPEPKSSNEEPNDSEKSSEGPKDSPKTDDSYHNEHESCRDQANGFSGFPSGSIIISNCNGFHLGSVFNYTMLEKPHKKPYCVPPPNIVETMFTKSQEVTDKDLRFLKRYIPISDFFDTYRELGLSDGEFENIKHDQNNCQNPEEIILQCLLEWKRNASIMDGCDPTVGRLAKVLWETGSQYAVLKWAKKILK